MIQHIHFQLVICPCLFAFHDYEMDLHCAPPVFFQPAYPEAKSSQHRQHHGKRTQGNRKAVSNRDAGLTDPNQKLFPALLIVGWVVCCTAVVYFVYIFAWKRGFGGRI